MTLKFATAVCVLLVVARCSAVSVLTPTYQCVTPTGGSVDNGVTKYFGSNRCACNCKSGKWACSRTCVLDVTLPPLGACTANGNIYKPGVTFQDPEADAKCSVPACICDPYKSGVYTCTTCPDPAGVCSVDGVQYSPGEGYKLAGSTCASNECVCDLDGSGMVLCTTCGDTATASDSPLSCLIDLDASGGAWMAMAPGDSYVQPDSNCNVENCICDPYGSGMGLCATCKPGYCYANGAGYAPGATFKATRDCDTATCTCDPKGSGEVTCLPCSMS